MKHVIRLLASSEICNHVNLLVRRLEDVLLFSVSCSVETVRARSIQPKFQPVRPGKVGRDPFNQNSDRSDREKRTTSKGGPVFSKLFRLDRTDPLSFGPKFPEILVEWIAPLRVIK